MLMPQLQALTAGMVIPYGGNEYTTVSAELASVFQPGDRLIVVQDTGDLLHIPATVWDIAAAAVERASSAFAQLGALPDQAVTDFYKAFAQRLADDETFAAIADANADDVTAAQAKGRSTTRLVLSERMRSDMIAGLEGWANTPSIRGQITEHLDHDGWSVDLIKDGVGVVGFVFEGRPNVFADATGVLRAGNTVVFRIGSDALGTAEAIVEHALDPALAAAGMPEGSVALVASPSRAAGWAMMANPTLALAVARGSGAAVAQLGAVARQAGNPVSLHGTGGAWMVAGPNAPAADVELAVFHSLDRKVCNTLNTACFTADRAAELIPSFLSGLERAADYLGTAPKLHVTEAARPFVPEHWFTIRRPIARAEGEVEESLAEPIGTDELGEEWEWEQSPEVTVHVVETVDDAVRLFNEQSPRFAASLISSEATDHDRFFAMVDAPFVGNGMTRWVDGQYALDRPELGLSNWQHGRLFGRGGVLSGDSVYTLRTRVDQEHMDIGRWPTYSMADTK